MTDATPGSEPPPVPRGAEYCDASGTLVTDVACRKCGYNLRGLHRDGRCPECGTSVGRSIQGDFLRFADPEWVLQLARGSRYVSAALTCFIILWILGAMGGGVLIAMLAAGGLGPQVASLVSALLALLGLGVFALLFYGTWLSTIPDPSRIGEDQYATVRKLTRAAVIIIAIGWIADAATEVSGPSRLGGVVLEWLVFLAALASLVGVLAYVRYHGRLAERIPDDQLVRRSRLLFRALAIFFGLVFVLVFMSTVGVAVTTPAPAAPAQVGTTAPAAATMNVQTSATVTFPGGVTRTAAPPPWALVVMAVGGCASAIAGLVLFFVYLRWQVTLAKSFEEQARLARQTWAQRTDSLGDVTS